jgi:hypothetical protein
MSNEKENNHKNPVVNPLLTWINNNLAGGATNLRSKGGTDEEWFNVARDMAKAIPIIAQTAGNLTYIQVTGDKEKEKHAYYLTHLLGNVYKACAVDNVKGLTLFNELYDELDKNQSLAEVFQLFSGYFMQATYAYIFTTRATAIGTIPKNEMTDVLHLSMLLNDVEDEDDRKTLLEILKKHEIWPITVPTKDYRRTLKDFYDACIQDFEAWELKNKNREATKNPNKAKIFKAV